MSVSRDPNDPFALDGDLDGNDIRILRTGRGESGKLLGGVFIIAAAGLLAYFGVQIMEDDTPTESAPVTTAAPMISAS